MNKEYVFQLEMGGEIKEWRCVVRDTEVVTYKDGQEHKHLKITNPVCKEGVLQIDTNTVVCGELVPFQLERNIPYVKIDGVWKMSETTRQDRLNESVKIQKKNMTVETSVGAAFMVAVLVKYLVTGEVGDWWMGVVMGGFCFASGLMRFVRMKQELAALAEEEEN